MAIKSNPSLGTGSWEKLTFSKANLLIHLMNCVGVGVGLAVTLLVGEGVGPVAVGVGVGSVLEGVGVGVCVGFGLLEGCGVGHNKLDV